MEKMCMSVAQMQRALGIGKNHAYALVKQEGFPAIHIGKRIIIPIDALREWLQTSVGKQVTEEQE